MNFWQIMAIIVIFVITSVAVSALIILRRALNRENDINERRLIQEKELHDQEAENWRQVDPALRKRIKELEDTCRDNQRVIGNLRLELLNKDQFLDAFKLKDLYEQGFWPVLIDKD